MRFCLNYLTFFCIKITAYHLMGGFLLGEIMKTIELHGILAKKFGRFFRLNVRSAKEASHALACQIPAYKAFMLQSERLGYCFAVFNGKKRTQATNIGEHELDYHTDSDYIHIVPRVVGSGGKTAGWIQTIAGVAMIVVGIVGTPFTGGTSMSLVAAGVGMLASGVATLLAPTPDVAVDNDDGNKPNNGFGGAVTTTAQGNPVPILYGRRLIGGFIVSAGITAYDKLIDGGTRVHNHSGNVSGKGIGGMFHRVNARIEAQRQ